MTTTSWTDTHTELCTCDLAECPNPHQHCELDDRYELQFDGVTEQVVPTMADLIVEVLDYNDPQIKTGEGTVIDLATKATMDAAEFIARYAA